jgi:octaprenyl-diphosphate synthase
VLDFTAHETVLGKPVGHDLWEGKVTLPLIYALECGTEDDRRLVAMVLKDRSYERVPFERVLELAEQRGGVERVRNRARAFTEKARAIIGGFPESPYQRALYAITDLVTERDY